MVDVLEAFLNLLFEHYFVGLFQCQLALDLYAALEVVLYDRKPVGWLYQLLEDVVGTLGKVLNVLLVFPLTLS